MIKSIFCSVVTGVGIATLIFLSMQLSAIENEAQAESEEELEVVVNTSEEQEIGIDCHEIFTYHDVALSEESVSQIAEELLGSNYLQEVTLKKESKPYTIQLSYYARANDMSLAKAKKDQLALVNAVALMSLYDEIDTVVIEASRESERYKKVLYRPDLEAYFGFELVGIKEESTYSRLVGTFYSSENVSNYWGMKHPYDCELGEDAEWFFKCYFSSDEEEISIPTNTGEIVKILEEKYGDALYIKGLRYSSASINYFCANELLRFYEDDERLEDILMELIICSNKTKVVAVKEGCNRVRDILSYKQDEPLLFTKYEEMGGGDTLYGISQGRFYEIARWTGQSVGCFSKEECSRNEDYILCKVDVDEDAHYYVLPLNDETVYEMNEAAVFNNGVEEAKELTSLMAIDRDQKEKFESVWQFGPYLQLGVGEEKYIYDCKNNKMQSEEAFRLNFSLENFLDSSDEEYPLITGETKKGATANSSYTKVITKNDEQIDCYEFIAADELRKVLSDKERASIQGQYIWHKGKVIIVYNGSDGQVINWITSVMK